MTQKRYTEIPKRQKCINKEEPYIGGAKDIIDDELEQPQSVINSSIERKYNSQAPNGMGKVVLKKNKSFASQVIYPNTIYVIQYDFILTDDVTIPENCILEFDGGSISGAYTITGQNTGIEAGLIKVFNTDITLAGSWNVAEAYPEWFGAKGDGVTDDTVFLVICLNSFKKLHLNKEYSTTRINVPSYTVIDGFDKGKLINNDNSVETLLITGNNTEDSESHNIIIKNLSIIGGKWAIQVYGETYTYQPHNIQIENLITKECLGGGVFLNSCHDVNISGLINYGGYLTVSTKAPIAHPDDLYNVKIEGCKSFDTTRFCYQTYYGRNITLINNYADGSMLNDGDRSCITIDRSKDSLVMGNLVENAAVDGLFVTGSYHITISNNIINNSGSRGVQICKSFEQDEDPSIVESEHINLSDNIIYNSTGNDILLNGVKDCLLKGNICKNNTATYGIYIMDSAGDVPTVSENIVLIGNVCNKIEKAGSFDGNGKGLLMFGNIYNSYVGKDDKKDVVIDSNTIGLSSKNAYIGLIQKEIPQDLTWLRKFTTPSGSYNIGFIEAYSYGQLILKNQNDVNAFKFEIGQGNNSGHFEVVGKGKGITLHSPDGNITKHLTIDNNGDLVVN